ncbi:MAG: hypothetical protein LAT65_18190 [Saccharospirillum sp.]|nr:hypothetical protein [Saccharospirillum sp.]
MPKHLLSIALISLTLAACNSSSGGGGSGNNDNVDDTSTNGGSTPGANTPAEIFRFSSQLAFSTSYTGLNDWAQPIASLYDGNAEDQQQRQMIDTAILGNALMAVPYHLTDRLFDHLGTEPADLIDFMEQAACPAGPVTLSSQSGGESFGPACVQVSNGDNAEITFSGNLHWHQSDADYDLNYEFQNLAVQWRGEDFVINGAGALYNELSWLLLAMDVHHTATNTTYRYWVRHKFGLSVSQPQIDLVAFHPDLGAMAQLAEGAFNSDNCTGGGYADKSGVLLNGDQATEAEAAFYYGFTTCDLYQIASGTSKDANGSAVPPELHPAYASLGMDFGPSQLVWRNGTDSHYQLAQDNPGATLLAPTTATLAKLGTQGDADAYTQYHLALTFNLSNLPAGISTEDDVIAASLRLNQVDGNNPYSFIRASLEEWTGTPDTVFAAQNNPINLSGNNSLVEPQPWLWGDATPWLKQALTESRTELQVIVGIETMLGLNEGDAFSETCLQNGDGCTAPLLPTIEVIY